MMLTSSIDTSFSILQQPLSCHIESVRGVHAIGFDEDEAQSKSDEGAVVLVRLLTT
jgi:hypothetical protein